MTFLDCLQAHARARPAHPAVVEQGTRVLTWAELISRAASVGADLRSRGLGPGSIVGIPFPRSADYVVAWLGIWWAGAACLPLPPDLPPERMRFMREGHPIVERIVDGPSTSPHRPSPDALAYLIYTSGSTGKPKGVMIPHRGIMNLLQAQLEAFATTSNSRVLWMLSPAFDASVSDIGTALLAGATLYIESHDDLLHDLLGLIARRGITHVDLPPSLLPRLSPDDAPASLQTVVIGGEVCPADAVRRWAPRVRLVNVYGPTEATVCTSVVRCGPDWERPWLGHPLPQTEYRVRDGELWIAGPGLFIGYRNLPDLTAARLVQQDRLWYRTGDLVREHPDGGIEFVGRMDRQVKIRGMLVSPEEIEARLAEHPDVRRAAVTANGTLTAHVATALVPSEARSRLRTHLVQSLPDWMIPQHWVFSNSLPETLSGKPVTTTEERLATLWCRILHLPGVSRTDRFKDLGGDSLKAIDLVVAAHAEGLPLGPDQVCGTLEQMAAAIDSPSAVPAEALRRDVAFSADFESLLDDAAARPLRSDPGATLVTGATGFLGSHLAARLPKNVYRLTLSPITPFDIPGDMSEPRMGLSSADWHRLTGEVDTIFHCAAGVNLVRSYADLRPTNVAGTQELLRFMATGRPKRLHHASSLSVFVTTDRSPGLMLESDTLDETGLVYGGYGQSKWAAEVMLRQSGHRAGPISYYRFGLLTGPVAPTDWLARFARGTVAVGCLPQEAAGLAFDMTPIDYAADAMVWLSRQPAGTWHVANAESATLADLAKALRAHGYPIEWVSPEVWATRAPAPMQAALGFRQGHEKQRPLDLFAATGMEFDTTLTTAALQGSGIAPLPPARELLHAYLGDVL